MKKLIILSLTVFLISSLISPKQSFAQRKFLTLASGSPGGVYYPLGGGMAVVIQKTTDLRCAAESTGASVENCRLVGARESDLGMVMGSIAYKATQGLEPFKEKLSLVALFQMYPAPEHIVTLSGKGIKTVRDLRGKKVSIDVPGSGCAVMAKAILEEYGFNLEKDLTIAHLSQSESVQALKDGVVDAVFFNFAYPGSAVLDLAATRDIVLIPIEPDMAEKITKKYPYYLKISIPAKTIPKLIMMFFAWGTPMSW